MGFIVTTASDVTALALAGLILGAPACRARAASASPAAVEATAHDAVGPVPLAAPPLSKPPISPRVVRVEAWPGPGAARVVVVLDRPAEYRVGDDVGATPSDARVFIDIDGVGWGASSRDIASEGVVTGVHGESTITGTRVWLDLDGPAWRHVFDLPRPYRIVVDVARRPPGLSAGAPRSVSRVVLDAGHGGSDLGARGPTGLLEKDVALDIVRRAAPALVRQGIELELTRDDDRFVSLEERTARANAFDADLFVSVHCNASESRGPHGVETYVLDTDRDAIAARVAARENEGAPGEDPDVGSILGGLRMENGARRSRRLARLLLRASTTALRAAYGAVTDGGVHAAGFYVLVGARMPAVLFETSYISNPVEEKRLASPAYRQLVADAIVNAVRAYREGR